MSKFNDPWNRALDGADCPQDGIQRPDIERLLEPGAHDIIKLPSPKSKKIWTPLQVVIECDCCHKEVPEEELVDCEVCTHFMCKECMWGDQICRCHYEE